MDNNPLPWKKNYDPSFEKNKQIKSFDIGMFSVRDQGLKWTYMPVCPWLVKSLAD